MTIATICDFIPGPFLTCKRLISKEILLLYYLLLLKFRTITLSYWVPNVRQKFVEYQLNELTAYKGLRVTVKLTIQNRHAQLEIELSASTLIIHALKEPTRDRKKVKNIRHVDNLIVDQIKEIAHSLEYKSGYTSFQVLITTQHTTNGTQYVCYDKMDCSIEEIAEDSKYITCIDNKCFCDDTCFEQFSDGRCGVKSCYLYSFGTDSCEFSGKNWRITTILAKYTGFFGGAYFYLGRWELGAIQLAIFVAIVITLPIIMLVYCLVGFLMLKIGVKLHSLYGIVKRVVISIVTVCCVHCLFVCVCLVWYIVVTVLVSQNLLLDSQGCGMGNEPEYIHVV
ncbi:60S ribosomal protein L12 [Oopsacas minuta]|uniref:60S ribosomal protein L12 n=1 Tax=Oopsacas minuta TaxID=111878 RepID=A0AAV7K5P9_9METZ|nr:60S ribosomal protein L12 [Oopsacas minuta]